MLKYLGTAEAAEAATSMGNEESGMYLLGTFVVDAIPDLEADPAGDVPRGDLVGP